MAPDQISEAAGGGDALPRGIGIFGPTASGKTAVAEELADRTGGAVVSADSMQVYAGLPILTNHPARPTLLTGIFGLEHEASVAEYQRLAHAAIDAVVAAGRVAVVAGGTGLYFRAALADLDLPPAPPAELRRATERLYDELGAEAAHARLAELDAAAAAALHPNDRRRIVRALELTQLGGSLAPARARLWSEETRHPTAIFGLDVPPDELERRIEERTRAMFVRGVRDEVAAALRRPLSQTARQALGLDDVARLPPEEAAAALVRRTRRLASYQRKWMRRIPGLVTVRADRPASEVADEIFALASGRERIPGRGGR